MNGNLQVPAYLIIVVLTAYFFILLLISKLIEKKSKTKEGNQDFFKAGKQSPWYIVAYGMIGASLSGVTFISIPGVVGSGKTNMAFSYMQVVLGYLMGYVVIAQILLPLYYRLGLTSIYEYLKQRFGNFSYKSGAVLFLISRSIGSAFRLYLAVIVMEMLFEAGGWNIPFPVLTGISILLIWLYTRSGGLKVIVWTDTLQTSFMLLSVIFTLYYIIGSLDFSKTGIWLQLEEKQLSQWFFFKEGWSDSNNFFKQFLGGMFITIVMTGLDQDMMQKNLSCKNLKEAKKNMLSFSAVLFGVNFLFLLLGALLYLYMAENNIDIPQRIVDGKSIPAYDLVFPNLALGHMPLYVGIIFIIGLIAAAYSTADSGLTALTTSFCIDILSINPNDSDGKNLKSRKITHIAVSVILGIIISVFWLINDSSVINQLFTIAGYTYGPLLGLFFFGLFIPRDLKDRLTPLVCLAAPILTFVINSNSEKMLNGYKFGFELLLLNGLLTLIGLLIISKKKAQSEFDRAIV